MLRLAYLALALFPLLAGCNMLAYPAYLMAPEPPAKTVAAEFEGLQNKTVAVVVYAGPQTQLDYQTAQMEVTDAVGAEMRRKIDGVKLIETGRVIRYQCENANWESLPPEQLCRTFKCDYVMLISLIEFGTREPGSEHLPRGRISAQCSVYAPPPASQPASQPTTGLDPAYRCELISVTFPTGDTSPSLAVRSEWDIRIQTEKAFAVELVKRFHKHQEPKE